MRDEIREIIGYCYYDLWEENGDYFRFDTKEELFEKMVELNEVDEYGVVRFKMSPQSTVFGFWVHYYTVSVIWLNEDGDERESIFNLREAACHKDGLHKRILVEY